MIISHKHRFIFVAVPKTGTHSVRQALRVHLGKDDLEQVGLFVHKRLPFPELGDLGHGHISASQVRGTLGNAMFNRYFSFAFVRNPFDRFVSYCAFMGRNSGEFERDPQAFMRRVLHELRPVDHILFRPQSEFVCSEDGQVLVNFIGRVESLQRDYDGICSRLGVASSALPQVNASSHRDYTDYYDDQLIADVHALYARDIELFGYSFDQKTAPSAIAETPLV